MPKLGEIEALQKRITESKETCTLICNFYEAAIKVDETSYSPESLQPFNEINKQLDKYLQGLDQISQEEYNSISEELQQTTDMLSNFSPKLIESMKAFVHNPNSDTLSICSTLANSIENIDKEKNDESDPSAPKTDDPAKPAITEPEPAPKQPTPEEIEADAKNAENNMQELNEIRREQNKILKDSSLTYEELQKKQEEFNKKWNKCTGWMNISILKILFMPHILFYRIIKAMINHSYEKQKQALLQEKLARDNAVKVRKLKSDYYTLAREGKFEDVFAIAAEAGIDKSNIVPIILPGSADPSRPAEVRFMNRETGEPIGDRDYYLDTNGQSVERNKERVVQWSEEKSTDPTTNTTVTHKKFTIDGIPAESIDLVEKKAVKKAKENPSQEHANEAEQAKAKMETPQPAPQPAPQPQKPN